MENGNVIPEKQNKQQRMETAEQDQMRSAVQLVLLHANTAIYSIHWIVAEFQGEAGYFVIILMQINWRPSTCLEKCSVFVQIMEIR